MNLCKTYRITVLILRPIYSLRDCRCADFLYPSVLSRFGIDYQEYTACYSTKGRSWSTNAQCKGDKNKLCFVKINQHFNLFINITKNMWHILLVFQNVFYLISLAPGGMRFWFKYVFFRNLFYQMVAWFHYVNATYDNTIDNIVAGNGLVHLGNTPLPESRRLREWRHMA